MFLGTLAGGLLALPLPAGAQPAGKVYRIGNLAIAGPTDTAPPPPANWESFQQGLRELGYVEGQNIAFEHRYAHGRVDLFPGLAADLVRLQVDIIFARGPQAVTAAKNATHAIPIVGIDLESDPVMTGLVTSLSRPGGNITGMFLDLAEMSGKQLQLLKELVPKLTRVAVLGDPVVNASQLSALNAVGRSLAIQVQVLELKSSERLEGAFEEAKREHVPHRLAGHRVDRLSLNYHLRAPSLRAGGVVVLRAEPGRRRRRNHRGSDRRPLQGAMTDGVHVSRSGDNRHCRGGSQEELAESSVASILPCFLRNTR
jgi:hypothetical protein